MNSQLAKQYGKVSEDANGNAGMGFGGEGGSSGLGKMSPEPCLQTFLW